MICGSCGIKTATSFIWTELIVHILYDMPGKDYGEGTCQVPCYLKVTAEFGTWAGAIVPEQLPKHFYVDYVRVFKEK